MMYDMIPLLNVVCLGNSIIDLKKGGINLSRRVIEYLMPAWPFLGVFDYSQRMESQAHSIGICLENEGKRKCGVAQDE